MVSGCDGEVKPSAHSPTRSAKSSPCASPARTLSHTSIVPNTSSSNLTTNGFDKNDIGQQKGIDMVQEVVGNGAPVDEDMDMDDVSGSVESATNDRPGPTSQSTSSQSTSNQFQNSPLRGS